MQIDVLSQNTLKLTLSRLDMFDLDIRYESLSGKNPDTKRLLSHVLKTVKLDKNSGVDFTGERLFVEAFPRPDGGCMLYISCLLESGNTGIQPLPTAQANRVKAKKTNPTFLYQFASISDLEGACRALSWQRSRGTINFTSSLFFGNGHYRLLINTANKKLITATVGEYGRAIDVKEAAVTKEHYKLLASDNAAELLTLTQSSSA